MKGALIYPVYRVHHPFPLISMASVTERRGTPYAKFDITKKSNVMEIVRIKSFLNEN